MKQHATQDLHLGIKGMSCASCVNRIQKGLTQHPGILKASVNLATHKAYVQFDTCQIKDKEIYQLIEKLGYEVEKKDTPSPSQELYQQRRLFLISLLLSLPLVLPMFTEFLGLTFSLWPWWQLLLATPVQFFIGAGLYRKAYGALKARTGNMELLVCLGTTAAYLFSILLMFKGETHHLYFESSAMIITLVLLGKLLESQAKQKTSDALKSLQKLKAEKARVLVNGTEVEKPLNSIQRHDLIIIKPGERIPVDGLITQGFTTVDESLITGEGSPVEKGPKDQVIGGSLNGDGLIQVQVKALGAETMLAKIIRLVEEAQMNKAPIQRLVDQVSAYFVPLVILVAILTLILTYGYLEKWEEALMRAVAVLVIACPCALGLATPTAIMVGVSVAARRGILIKNVESLELTHQVSVMVFDKTGTLTQGAPRVSQISTHHFSQTQAIRIMASLQQGSEHPLAQGMLTLAQEQNLKTYPVKDLKRVPGKGIEGRLGEKEPKVYALASRRWVEELKLSVEPFAQELEAANLAGETTSFLMENHKGLLAMVSFHDPLKPQVKETITQLKQLGLKTLLLSGDNRASVSTVAEDLKIDEFRAELLPEQKSQVIQELMDQGQVVAMVGDGMNDAPALALAHVGMAMSTGTDVAMETSDLTLMRGHPMLIPDAIHISRKTYKKIKQNLFWALIYNVIGIPLAALGFLNPMVAASAMALSSVSVVLNALSLKKWNGLTSSNT